MICKDGGEKSEAYRLRAPQRILCSLGSSAAVDAHATQRLEARIGQHEDAAVVGLEVVDLFAKEQDPEILAHELDRIQWRLGAWLGGGKPVDRRINGDDTEMRFAMHVIAWTCVAVDSLPPQ